MDKKLSRQGTALTTVNNLREAWIADCKHRSALGVPIPTWTEVVVSEMHWWQNADHLGFNPVTLESI